MKKLKIMTVLTSLLIFGTSVCFEGNSVKAIESNSVSQEDITLNEDISYLKDWLTKYDVPSDVQNNLIDKFKNGEQWDSLKEDSIPVKNEEIETATSKIHKSTYNDGSITIIEEEKILDDNSTARKASVTGGRIVSKSAYHMHVADKKISASAGIVSCSFYCEYVTNRSAFDELKSVYDYNINVIGGTYSNDSLSLVKRYEDYNGKAKGSLSFKYTTYASSSDHLIRLNVFVGGDNITASHN